MGMIFLRPCVLASLCWVSNRFRGAPGKILAHGL
jgi:hypothetical protein